MNVLSHQLNQAAEQGKFGYHPKCKESKLTHLCFADDLLIFTDGSPTSVQGIINVLAEFQTLSGLAISPEKSCFFPSGLSPEESLVIETQSGIPQGELPIRYLGLPLCTKKLNMVNCEPLLQKIKRKIKSWTSKYLSLAGRLQLLNSVISGITNFWCGAFVIPKRCIKLINSMCSAFLWKGNLEGRHVAKVAWETVTTPKEEGGLGVKNLLVWNRTCSIKLIWMLLFRTESVWSAWIHQNVIKDCSFWDLKSSMAHTWTFRHLLKLRSQALQWYRIVPGNGNKCRFWKDPWTDFGPLITFIGDFGPRHYGIHRNALVSSVWSNGSWRLPPARSDKFEQLLIHLSSISLTEVSWAKLVWIKRGIPKHKTLTWLFTLNRCPTRDRLLAWGLQVNPVCLLCNQSPENRDHLFFECSYSNEIWSNLSSRIAGQNLSTNWNSVLTDLLAFSANRIRKYLLLIAWQSTIFEIWKARNNVLHQNFHASAASIIRFTETSIKNRILSFRPQNPTKASEIMQLWLSL